MAFNPSSDAPLRIATRRSPLALAQTHWVRDQIADALNISATDRESALPILPFVTTGDKEQRSSLADIGGKGLFTKEIEAALLSGDADIAVHSMKDMPAALPPGLIIAAVPKRENPFDAFVTVDGRRLEDLPPGAKIGTSSARRAAQVRRLRPDLEIVPFRGNVDTRLRKLTDGVADGTFLAEAGLLRLGRQSVSRQVIEKEVMLPALGQGILCLQTRADDVGARTACQSIHCDATGVASAAERAIVNALDGSCRTPMAGIAEITENGLSVVAEILTPDGVRRITAAERRPLTDHQPEPLGMATQIGLDLASRMRADAGDDFARITSG